MGNSIPVGMPVHVAIMLFDRTSILVVFIVITIMMMNIRMARGQTTMLPIRRPCRFGPHGCGILVAHWPSQNSFRVIALGDKLASNVFDVRIVRQTSVTHLTDSHQMRNSITYAFGLAVFVAIGSAIADQLWYGEPKLMKAVIVGLCIGIGVAAFRHWKDNKNTNSGNS